MTGNPEENRKKEQKRFFDSEGPAMTFLTKTGELIILSFLWFLCSLPVFTMGAASSALYCGVVKNIRRDRSSPAKEFFKAFKRNFRNATLITIIVLVWGSALARLIYIAISMKNTQGSFLMRIYTVIAIITVAVLIYLFPIVSRFSISVKESIELAFVMAVKNIGYTVFLLLASGFLVYLYIYYVPILTIIILPSLWAFLSSFLIEKAMRKYMPEPKEGDEFSWLYE